jgi:GMP synthase-like glutamine amidotransferase
VLRDRHIELEYADLYLASVEFPDISRFAGLVFLGGAMSVNDGLPYLGREEDAICQALHSGQPVLGLCLGAQLLAKVSGARVYASAATEIGWFPVKFTPEASHDSLFRSAGSEATVFQWHYETFDLPSAATLLATSEACPHQAFRLGNAWGLQFHLEVTPAMIADWCEQDANCTTGHELDHPIDSNGADNTSLAEAVFGAWADLL